MDRLKMVDSKIEINKVSKDKVYKWTLTTISDILRDILKIPIDILIINRKFSQFIKTEAWKSYSNFRTSEEVAETAEYIKKLAKARVEFGILENFWNWRVIKRIEPVALIKYDDVIMSFMEVASLYKKFRKQYLNLIVDINIFKYVVEENPVDFAERMLVELS